MSDFNNSLFIKLSFLFPALFYGCAHIPKHELTAHLESSSTLSHISKGPSTVHTSELVNDWPNEKWWESFEDPQLNNLVETALKESPNLQRVQSRLQKAIQTAKMQRSSLFPSLKADLEIDWMYFGQDSFYRTLAPTLKSTYTELQVGLSFSYEFDFWGKNRNLLTAALGMAKADEAEVAQSILLLTTSIAFTYFEMQFHEKQLSILQEIKDEKETLLELLKLRKLYFLDSAFPGLTLSQEIEEIKARIAVAKECIELNTHLLKALAGIGQDATIEVVSRPLSKNTYFIPETLQIDLLARRPDLLAQIWRVEACAHTINAAKADFYPNIDLKAIGGFQSLELGNLLTTKSLIGNLTPAIHLPIFTGGKLTAHLKETTAVFEEAVFAYNELVQKAAREVVDELSSLKSISDRIQYREKALSEAEERYHLSKLRFENKIDSYMKPLQELQQVLNHKLELTNLKYSSSLQAVKLIKALGGGYHMPHKPSETVQRYQYDNRS